MHPSTSWTAGIPFFFALSLLAVSPSAAQPQERLGMQKFYGKGDPYSSVLETRYKTVRPYTGPFFGWKTDGKPAASPTKVAGDGLTHLLDGRVDAARDHAEWLVDHAIRQHDALFFPFGFDYAPIWPYDLKAPWYSALTQGLGLTLCVYLHRETGESRYLQWAHAVYRSFQVPVEQGGITRFEDDGPFFAEYPTPVPTRVLNGAAAAMLAVHDYARVTGNSEAMVFFRQSVTRLEKLLPQYDTLTEEGIVASYYSLAPSRTDILGRFKGSANLFVTRMRVHGHRGDQKTLLASVDVGSPGDHEVMRNFHVWPDPEYMNWGPPRSEAEGGSTSSGREVNGRRGEYDHSPFKFFINRHEEYEVYSVEISWSRLPGKAHATGQIDVQLYDGEVYWKAGTLAASNEAGRAEFPFPEGFYAAWTARDTSAPTVEERYLDENQALVALLGELADSSVCRAYARRWQASLDLVPGPSLHALPPSLFSYVHPEPVIPTVTPGEESIHAEYPSVIRIGETFHMFYCAFGDRRRWRLFHATSRDARKWTRHGEVFGEESLPSDMKGNLAFPHVVKDLTSPGGVLLYFAAAREPGKPYGGIHHARSKDGRHWHYGGVSHDGSGLDPLVMVSSERRYELYYTRRDASGQFLLMHARSADGRLFDEPNALLTFPAKGRGLYTLSGLHVDRRFLLFIESSTPAGRHDTLLWIRDEDGFEPFEGNPLIVDRDWIPRWDATRYGFNFVTHGDRTLLFYNGIAQRGAEEGGQIGLAEFDLARLKRMMK